MRRCSICGERRPHFHRRSQVVRDDVLRASREERERPAPSGWLRLGLCPEPRTAWETFRYHVGHGLVMGYPLHRIVAWSWRNRRSFSS